MCLLLIVPLVCLGSTEYNGSGWRSRKFRDCPSMAAGGDNEVERKS